MVKKGMAEESGVETDRFFNWMERSYGECINDIRLKVLEFVLMAEHIAYESGGMVYHFTDRAEYLTSIMSMNSLEEMRSWFINKISQAARNVVNKKHEYSNGVIERAKEYIEKNYKKDISLDEVSQEVDMSSYYFSKLFKEVSGYNFIEYVTNMRIELAKELLMD